MTHAKTVELTEGLTLSRLIPGFMRLREWGLTSAELLDWIKACIDMGLTSFDHADIYGGYTVEAIFGAALELEPSLRDKMQIITKCGIQLLAENRPDTYVHHYNTTRAHIVWSVEESLKMLRTDYIDLLLIHRPDPLMDADDIAAAFTDLHDAGKVRHFGVSNFTPRQIELLQSRVDYPLVTNQVEISVLHMEALHDGTLDYMQQHRLAPMAWSAIAGGRIFTGGDEQAERVKHTLGEIASAHGAAVDQVALAWLLAHPTRILPILGTGKLDRIRSAVGALEVELTRQEWFAIWEASAGHEVP